MWWILIVIILAVFLFFIYALNPDKVKALFKRKQKTPKIKEEKPKKEEKSNTPSNPNFSYEEYKPEKHKEESTKVDNLKKDNLHESEDKSDMKSSEVAYTTLKEEIAKEKAKIKANETGEGEDKTRKRRLVKGGRKSGAVKSAEVAPVEVEDLGEYDENAGFDDDEEDTPNINQSANDYDIGEDDYDLFNFSENKSIGQEIRNLSPELKTLLIDNVLSKKTDEDKK